MKKIIIIAVIAVLGVGSFVGSMLLSKKLKPAPPAGEGEVAKIPDTPEGQLLHQLASGETSDLKPKEQQLVELIKEVRAKMNDLDRRSRDLDERERRLKMATDQLKKQSDQLEKLRIELVAIVPRLKSAKGDLMRYRTLITAQEVVNLQNAASMWSKMEPSNVARLILEMFKNNQGEAATKIIRFMDEKSWAAVMDEIKELGPAVEIIRKQLNVIREEKQSV